MIFSSPQRDEFEIRPPRAYAPPSVWILFALLAGYACAVCLPELRNFAGWIFSFGLAAFAAGASFSVFCVGCGRARRVLFLVGFGCSAASYFFLRVPENPYPDFAPTEADLTARICDVSKGQNGSLYGTAEVVSCGRFPRLVGLPVWFTVSDGKGGLAKPLGLTASECVRFDGVLSPTDGKRYLSRGRINSRSRDFDSYLSGKFVHYKIFAQSCGVEKLEPAGARFGFYSRLAAYMDASLSALPLGMSADSVAAREYRAMILGDKSLLSRERKEAFARTGVMHVFAISGLHVGFAAAILYFALTVLRVPWRYQAAAGLPILFLYVCACGGRPSAMRAFSMVALVWIASLLGRGAKPIDSLVLAAAVSLVLFPRDLGDAGFALSYCIAASIFVYSLPLFAILERRFEPRVLYGGFMRRTYSRLRRGAFGFFVGGACISFGCALAAFPLSAHYFGYASLLSALYSPLFVFAAGVAVSLGFAGFFLPAFLAQWLNAAACAVVWAMDWGAMRIKSLADMAVDFTLPSGFAAALAAVGFLAASDWLGRIRPQWAGFVLAPLAAGALIFLYKIAF